MNANTRSLSEGCIRELFTFNSTEIKQPALQILGFQESEVNEKQIIIRVSDGLCFVDCSLSGNYQILDGVICQIKNNTAVTHFKQFHVVRLVDYFSKLDEAKICRLKIIIRKMIQVSSGLELVGCPQEIQQYMLNNKKVLPGQQSGKKLQREIDNTVGKTQESPIKLQDVLDPQNTSYNYYPQSNQPNFLNSAQASNNQAQITKSLKREKVSISNENAGLSEPLTLSEIMSGKDGYIIGRLVRYKHTTKQTKDGPMTVCYLGLLDRNNELIRIHLAGRLAMNNEKILKRNKCYYIRGFDLVPVKSAGLQIRLKDKEYKILEIYNEEQIRHLNCDYFHWDHESEAQNEFIDVIGLVDDIEEKANYTPNNQSDRSVIRVVVRNRFKSIRISFWTDQLKNLESFNLKRKEWIIIQDIRKKQSKYYDFGFQSNLIKVTEEPNLIQRFRDIFPQVFEDQEPQTIKDLGRLYEKDPTNGKLRSLNAYFTHCSDNKIIYRLCEQCKKKVQKRAEQCQQCGSQNLAFRYNCPLEFSDSTGSIVCVLFDTVASRFIGKTANQVSQLNDEEIERIFETLNYRPYLLTVQYRNQRFIMKAIEPVFQEQEVGQTKLNLGKISQIMHFGESCPALKSQECMR